MDRARFQRLGREFATASERAAAERGPLLAALRQEDPELCRELERLLAEHDARTDDSLLAAGVQLRRDLAGVARGAEPLPAAVGRFRVVGEIARGGIGRILRAEDPTIGRQVAVKVLRPEFLTSEPARRLLAEEGRLGGRLQHPSIVPVYEIGTTATGEPYLAMKIVDGRDFASLLAARKDPHDDRTRVLAVFEQICQAIAYAHECGVVHRDLKPHNVMVGAFGEVQVMDWGIALQIDGAGAAAMATPTVSGTPAYMAPEQARGDVARTDRRTDVFGLGAILCEILTGAPPYGTGPTAEVLDRARRADQTAMRSRLADQGDPDLVHLALACLAPDPAARPATAAAVATAVHEHIASTAQRLRRAELDVRAATARAASECKARRLVAALAIVGVAVVAAGAWTWIGVQAAAQRRMLDGEQRLTAALIEAERRFAVADADAAGDAAAWDAALQAARAATALADANVGPVLGQRAKDLLRDTQRLGEDLHFVAALTAAGSESACTNRFDRRPMAQALRNCMQQRLGRAIDGVEPVAAAAALAPIRWRERLVTGLDAWMRLELESDRASAVARWVRAIADQLDGDDWRRLVRAACAELDIDALRRLADDAAAATARASTLRQLALGLLATDDLAAGIAVLRRCVAHHPNDFDALLDLGWLLLGSSTLLAPEEAQRFAQATLAARPRHPAAMELQAQVLGLRGDTAGALLLADAIVAQTPGEPSYRRTRAMLRGRADDLEGAADDYAWTIAQVETTHAAWPVMALEAAGVEVRRGDLDAAWQYYQRAIAAPSMRGTYLLEVGGIFAHAALAEYALARAGEPRTRWSAWLLRAIALRERSAADALDAIERVTDAPTWALQLASRLGVELRERLGGVPGGVAEVATTLSALPPGIDLDESRRRLASTLQELRAAGRLAAAAHLEGLVCERAGQPAAAAPHYRQAIAEDRDAVASFVRLHACVAATAGDNAADAEIRALLQAHVPGPVLRLPLRRPTLRTEPPASGDEFRVTWTSQPGLDARRPPFTVHLRVTDDAVADDRQSAVELWLAAADGAFAAPAGVLEGGRRYTAKIRLLCPDVALQPGPWSAGVEVAPASRCTPVPVDLTPWARHDIVADPGDPANDAFDTKNGYALLVDGFDGSAAESPSAQGLPRDRRLGLFLLGPYASAQTIRLEPRRQPLLRIDLPAGRYTGLHVLAAAANGTALIPMTIVYDGSPAETLSQLTVADWFNGSAPPVLAAVAIGMPVLRGMDRIGRDGFEDRDAAVLFDAFVTLDPTRVVRSIVLLLDRAHGEEGATVANLLAITAMRPPADADGGR